MEAKKTVQDYPKVLLEFSPKFPPLKKITDKTKINLRYALIPPFAFAHIYWDPKISELLYDVEEPYLNRKEEEDKNEITSAMVNIINIENVVEKSNEALLDYIDKMLKFLAVELGLDLSYESYKKIFYYLIRDFIGFNEVDPLLKDYLIVLTVYD